MKILESTLGHNHPRIAVSASNLGAILREKPDLAGSRQEYARALAIDETTNGTDHPEVAADLRNLAEVYSALGNKREAKRLLDRAAAMGESCGCHLALASRKQDSSPCGLSGGTGNCGRRSASGIITRRILDLRGPWRQGQSVNPTLRRVSCNREMKTTTAERVSKHREKLKAAGLRPIQIWVPDTRRKGFADNCRRQSRMLKDDPQEAEVLAWMMDTADYDGWR